MRASHVRLPAELQRSAPRDTRLTKSGAALAVLTAVLAAGSVVAGVGLYVEAQRQFNAVGEMDRRGVTTQATVDRVWRKKDDGKPAFAAFHFDANGVRIHGQTRMHLSVWRELHAGSTVRVRYLPDNPGRWVVNGMRREQLPFWVSSLVASVLAAGASICGIVLRCQRTLLREGRPARAVVTAVHKHHGQHGTHTGITYEFPLLGGGQARGKAAVSKAPAVGTTVTIVYDPDRPDRSRPYPFSLVRAHLES